MYGRYTIVAYSSHFGEEGMELEWCMEAEVENQIVVHEHCNTDHATQDMQVGRIRGLQEVAVVYQEGMEHRREVACGKEVAAAVVNYRREEGEHIRPLLAAQKAGNRMFGDEDQSAAVVNWIVEFDDLQKESYMLLLS